MGKKLPVHLEQIMEYRITAVSLSLFTADGTFHKSVKSTFMTLLNLQSVTPPSEYHAIIDVGMAWNKMPPKKTWSEYASSLFNYIVGHHLGAIAVHFINDIYEELLQLSPK